MTFGLFVGTFEAALETHPLGTSCHILRFVLLCGVLENAGNKAWSLLSCENDRRWQGPWKAPARLLKQLGIGQNTYIQLFAN